ncbi:hypothetical protein [Thalassospira marina]|uniref:Uncharacterized protein n=1 Tax=Thalassospira marina TaxID=2048283 RepID=A0ABM6Q8J3_9PROT|nr:hypothetical protein [Thalassospira marina]AUG52836.1 hypothetical protein CSC3H3_09045 [Thalassospira marina]
MPETGARPFLTKKDEKFKFAKIYPVSMRYQTRKAKLDGAVKPLVPLADTVGLSVAMKKSGASDSPRRLILA